MNNFKNAEKACGKPIKLSDIMAGTTIDLFSENDDNSNTENEIGELFWSDVLDIGEKDLEVYKNPCASTFQELKENMVKISDGVFKKVLKKAANDAKEVDLQRTRVVYHRNLFLENSDLPFDSTYLSSNAPDEICLPLKNKVILIGFGEALNSMKEGEQSLFVVSYKKMFGVQGCPVRVPAKADILCDIKVIKVEDVGDESTIKHFMSESAQFDKYSSIQDAIKEARARAVDFFSKQKYHEAIQLYKRIIQNVQFAKTDDDKEIAQRRETMKEIQINLAVCYGKKEDWKGVMTHIGLLEEMGEIDSYPKALFNKGRALMHLGHTDEAKSFLIKAQRLAPLNPDVNKCIEELSKKIKAYDNFNRSFGENLKKK